jgi:hypothetical protein
MREVRQVEITGTERPAQAGDLPGRIHPDVAGDGPNGAGGIGAAREGKHRKVGRRNQTGDLMPAPVKDLAEPFQQDAHVRPDPRPSPHPGV